MTVLKKAVIKSYDAATHEATVQIAGSLGVWLDGIRVATDIPAADVVAGRQCTVLFLDPSNQDDAVVITVQGALPSADIAARVYNSANISTASGAWQTLTFNSERYDTDNIHSTVSNTGRLTATTAGKYSITANIRFANNPTNDRGVRFLLNGTTVIAQDVRRSGAIQVTEIELSTDYDLAATDYIECQSFQDSGGALDIIATANHSPEFMMIRIAPSSPPILITDHGQLTGLGDHDHSIYARLAQAETWAALQTFNAGVKLAAGQAIKDSGGSHRITLDAAASPPVTMPVNVQGPARINTGTVGADMDLDDVTDAEGTYQRISGLGSGGSGVINFGRNYGGVGYGLLLEGAPTRFLGTLEINYGSPGVILDVKSIGATAFTAIDSFPLTAELDLTAGVAQAGKAWGATKSRLTFRGTALVPNANAIDALVTRSNTAAGVAALRGISVGWVNDTASGFSALAKKSFYGIDVLAPAGAASLGVNSDAFGIYVRDQGAKGGVNVYGIKLDDISAGTNRHLLEAGPATPYMRLIGGAAPGANLTNLYLNEGATLRRVQWKDGGSIGAGDRVMVLV